MATNIVIKSPKGIAEWAYLSEPTKPTSPKDSPKYKVNLVATKEVAMEFNKQIAAELLAARQAYIVGKTKPTDDGGERAMVLEDTQSKFPFKAEKIDGEATGRWVFEASRSAQWVDKDGAVHKVEPIKVVSEEKNEDGNWKEIDASIVGNGSEVTLAILKRPIFQKDGIFSQPFWLQAVQVHKLVEYRKGQSATSVF